MSPIKPCPHAMRDVLYPVCPIDAHGIKDAKRCDDCIAPTDPACSDPNCSYRVEMDRRTTGAEAQASYWKSHSQDVERQLKTLILERKDLISKLERLKPRF